MKLLYNSYFMLFHINSAISNYKPPSANAEKNNISPISNFEAERKGISGLSQRYSVAGPIFVDAFQKPSRNLLEAFGVFALALNK